MYEKNGSENIGYQAVKDNDPWNMLNKHIEHIIHCLKLLPGQIFQVTGMGGKTQPACLPELRTQIWKSGETKAARIYSTWKRRAALTENVRNPRDLPWIFSSVHVSICIWKNNLKMEKDILKDWKKQCSESAQPGIVPVLTARVENFIT